MRILVALILILIIADRANGQTFNINFSEKHLSKINKAKSGATRLKKYKKFFTKDSTRFMKKLDKQLRRKADSLTRLAKNDQRLRKIAERKGLALPMDTLAMIKAYSSILPTDSTKTEELKNKGKEVARTKLKESLNKAQQEASSKLPTAQQKQLQELQTKYGPYSKEVVGYLGFVKDSIDVADTLRSIAAKKAESLIENKVAGAAAGELGDLKSANGEMDKLTNAPDEYKQKIEEYSDPEKMKALGKQKAEQQMADQLANAQQKLQPVMGKMSKLKSKYSEVLNSNDLSTAVKARSLEGKSFRERLIIGGNYSIVSTAPLLFDISPLIGYKIDKRFMVGVTGVYRASFVDSVKIRNSITTTKYGYSVFSRHELFMNFFGYTELERTAKINAISNSEAPKISWATSLLIGVGRNFKVHPKVVGSLMILWNPLHENGVSPYHNGLVIKTGFQLAESPFKKKLGK